MGNGSRHHHYIPQCYLRGFARPGRGKHPQITVTNFRHRTQFETNPRNIAGERDFNRIEVEGRPPDEIERGYADFEGRAAESLTIIRQTNKFEGNDRLHILNLIALIAVRSPQMREHLRKFYESISKRIMDLALATRERWEDQIAQLPPELRAEAGPVDYERMKEFHDRDEYSVHVGRNHQIRTELDMVSTILPHLTRRHWAMYFSIAENHQFVTSDRPVLLQFRHPEQVPLLYRDSPGFGLEDTRVIFPLDRHRVLIGEFDGDDFVGEASPLHIGAINSMICSSAFDQFYSSGRTIDHLDLDGKLYRDGHILDRLFPRRDQPTGA